MSLCTNAETIDLLMPRIKLTRDDIWQTPIPVNWKSPKPRRLAVYRMAQFFRREFHYDFVQYGYEGNESDDPHHAAYLWIPPHCIADWSAHCIGACCFRKREDGCMWLQWIWIHPFFRRRGLLSAAWPKFKAAHGDFGLETPLSDAMQAFAKSMNPAATPPTQ